LELFWELVKSCYLEDNKHTFVLYGFILYTRQKTTVNQYLIRN